MNLIKRFFKEFKRVIWPKPRETSKSLLRVLLFVGIIAIILFGMSIGFAAMWNAWGVGING